MQRLSVAGAWQSSFLGRLVAFAFETWDHSLTGRLLTGLGRLGAKLFEGSLPGKVWYSNWPGPRDTEQSTAGRMLGGLNRSAERAGRWVGPWLLRLWESSLLAGLYRRAARFLAPWLTTNMLWQVYTGYAADVEMAATETGRSRTSPVVYLLGALLGLLPLVPSEMSPSPTVLMIAGVWGTALFWLIRKVALGDFRWRASSGFLPLAVFLLMALASTFQSANFASSVLSLVIWATAILLFWMIVNLVRNSRDAAVLLGPVLTGGSLMAFWAMYQVVRPPLIEEAWVDPTAFEGLVRVFASMGNPNYLAEYMALYLPLSIALWFQQPKRRLELAIPLGLMALALVLSYSRGGWLALVIAGTLFVLMRFTRWSIFLFLAGLAAPVVAPESILRRFVSAFTLADSSNMYRVNLWKGVGAMLEKFWPLGSGLGAVAFAEVYSEFMLPAARAAHAHNTYLQMFAETGIFGLIAILWALIAIIRRPFVVGVNPRNAPLIAAVPAALIGLLFHGLVEHIWYNPKLLFAFWAVAGIGMGMALGDREDAKA